MASLHSLRAQSAACMQEDPPEAIAIACGALLNVLPSADLRGRVQLLASILKGLLALADQTGLESLQGLGTLTGCHSAVDARRSLSYALTVRPNANAVATCFVCFFELLHRERIWFGQVRTALSLALQRSVLQ
jgi:hypothetical protein